jgi:hypothetical protein
MTHQNEALEDAIAKAGLSPRALISEVNWHLAAVGHEPHLHRTGAYPWLRGTQPRSIGVRHAVAFVLSRHTGHRYEASDFWPGTPADTGITEATDGLTGPIGLMRLLDTAAEFASLSAAGHIRILPVYGAHMISRFLDPEAVPGSEYPRYPTAHRDDHILPAMVVHLRGVLADLRRLDDQTGGGAVSHRWVRNTLANVLDLLRHGHYTRQVGEDLLQVAAGLAQLAGWMSFDAGMFGAAERYHLLALRLAQACADTNAYANNLGMLAYQCATTGNPLEAVRLATAATEATQRSHTLVRARAYGRLATAHAAAGEISAHRASAEICRNLLGKPSAGPAPADLYYYTGRQRAAEEGHALLMIARARPDQADDLAHEAAGLLAPMGTITSGANGEQVNGYGRSSVLHGIHLARAQLLCGDRSSAETTVSSLVSHLPQVQSLRCRGLLTRLRDAHGDLMTRDTRRMLDRALSIHDPTH